MTYTTLHIGIELECIRKYKQSALYYFGEKYHEFKPYFNHEGGRFSSPREWIHDPDGQLGPLNLEKLRTMFVDFINQHDMHIQANAPAKQSIDSVAKYIDDPTIQVSIITKADDPASLVPAMQWLQSRDVPFNNVFCFSETYPSEHVFFDIFIYPSMTDQPDFINDMTGVTIGFDKQTSFKGLSRAIEHIRSERNNNETSPDNVIVTDGEKSREDELDRLQGNDEFSTNKQTTDDKTKDVGEQPFTEDEETGDVKDSETDEE